MTFVIRADDSDDFADMHALFHYGTPRHSGRYPWGSGNTPEERSSSFLGQVNEMRKQGLKDTQIAEGLGMNTTKLRAAIAISGNIKKQSDIRMAQRLKEKNMSNTAIAERMFGSKSKESVVRSLLAPGAKDKADILRSTADTLKARVDKDGFIDIGKGTEHYVQNGIAPTKLNVAVAMLEHEGYVTHTVPINQLGTGQDTRTKVLCPPGTKWQDVANNTDKIVGFKDWSEDGGRHWVEPEFPKGLDSKRVQVKYKEEGGDQADGVIYVRPGAKDLDMGGAHYAQVRILVDGTHYIKGMAVLNDNLPKGVDVQFNTNKKKGTPMLGPKNNTVLKPVERDVNGNVDKDNPFGSSIRRQIFDANGKLASAVNIVNDEAHWDDWSRNLASQMLSKQKPELVKSQLELTYKTKKAQLDEIMALTNPTVKERLLRSYADDMDSSSIHLKAARMPRQKTHVILPINTLKENEIFAPGYKNGETVVLIRYPHGGKFEIPTLTVNNRNALGNKLIHPDALAAVGINHKVAARLSGADFDGDTVVVIPNNHGYISTEHPLPGLRGFDPQSSYPDYPGNQHMKNTQTEMGKISNLITDMTIKGAGPDELAAAVRHSMVVIDAEKHGLDYKSSYIENGIRSLQKKYQPGPHAGAATLISRITGDKRGIPDFKPRPASEGGPIDPKTGKLVFVPSGKQSKKRVVDKQTGEVTWVPVPKTVTVQKGHRVLIDDAKQLITGEGTPIERLYADYSNRVRSLADQARLEMVHNTKPLAYDPSAKAVYHKEVASLNAKLTEALRNAPLERQAQVLAAAQVKLKKDANPNMDADVLKKVKDQSLKTARMRVGADKKRIGSPDSPLTDQEWAAIQAGAITHTKLKAIMDNANLDRIKELATPRTNLLMQPTKVSRAKALAASGYTQAEIADELGVSISTLRRSLNT